MKYVVVIPARYGSTRLPGKVLQDLAGKTLLHRVYDCVTQSSATNIIIATDDYRVQQECERIGAQVCMTADTHTSGTERIAEVIDKLNIDPQTIVVNVQGDEPFLPAACIEQVADMLIQDPQADMATLATPLAEADDVFNSNVVKVVINQHGRAMYFSRAAIPWYRDEYEKRHVSDVALKNTCRHIGLYGYRAGFVKTYVNYAPCELERSEKLEQLRALWYGHAIKVAIAEQVPGPGIDSEADLLAARAILMRQAM